MVDRNRYADQLFAQVIKARDRVCRRCGRGDVLQCSHVIPRRFLRVRWEPDNAWALCPECHYLVDTNDPEKRELIWETIGPERHRELYEQAHATDTPKPDRVQIRAQLRQMLKDLEAV
jgi:hypothetical protein